MTVEDFGTIFTLLITMIGWGVTYYYQRKILEKQILAEKEKLTIPRVFKNSDEIVQWLIEGQSLATRYIYVQNKNKGYSEEIKRFMELIPKLQNELSPNAVDDLKREHASISKEFQNDLSSMQDAYVTWVAKYGYIMTQYQKLIFSPGMIKNEALVKDIASTLPTVVDDYTKAIQNMIFGTTENDNATDQMASNYLFLLDLAWTLTDKVTSNS